MKGFTLKPTLKTNYGQQKYNKKVNQYLIICSLGNGTFANVYLAKDTITGQLYALKRICLTQLLKFPSGLKFLQKEINLMKKLSHPNVLELKETIHLPSKKTVYLVLEYCDCLTLRNIIYSQELNKNDIRSLFKQLVNGVNYLHQMEISHRDIKPSNILISSSGHVKISDFGIGHTFQSNSIVVGTPAYQAPEFIDERFNEDEFIPGKEDVWSLGVTLFELAFRKLPFSGENVFEIVRSIMNEKLEFPSGADALLKNLILGMLQVDPKKRMSLSDVMDHDYVSKAVLLDFPRFEPFHPLRYNSDLPIKEFSGVVCDENYSFAQSFRSHKSAIYSYSNQC